MNLADFLASLNASLLFSTYQAGKLAVIGSHQQQLTLSFHNFDRPMGVAIDANSDAMAVAARDKVWFLRNARDIAARLEPKEGYDACFLTRAAQVTGEIQAHEMAWGGDQLGAARARMTDDELLELGRLAPDGDAWRAKWRELFDLDLGPGAGFDA